MTLTTVLLSFPRKSKLFLDVNTVWFSRNAIVCCPQRLVHTKSGESAAKRKKKAAFLKSLDKQYDKDSSATFAPKGTSFLKSLNEQKHDKDGSSKHDKDGSTKRSMMDRVVPKAELPEEDPLDEIFGDLDAAPRSMGKIAQKLHKRFRPVSFLEQSLAAFAVNPHTQNDFLKELIKEDLFVLQDSNASKTGIRCGPIKLKQWYEKPDNSIIDEHGIKRTTTSLLRKRLPYLPVFTTMTTLVDCVDRLDIKETPSQKVGMFDFDIFLEWLKNDQAKIPKEFIRKPYTQITGQNLFEYTLGTRIIINPGMLAVELIPEVVEKIVSGEIFDSATKHLDRNKAAADPTTRNVMLAQPSERPSRLLDAIEKILENEEEVNNAYLAVAVRCDDETDTRHFVIGLDVRSEETFRRIRAQRQQLRKDPKIFNFIEGDVTVEELRNPDGYIFPGDNIVFVPTYHETDIVKYMLEDTKPFYQRMVLETDETLDQATKRKPRKSQFRKRVFKFPGNQPKSYRIGLRSLS